MDFPTFPPHFPNTDYLFYPSLHPSSAFSIPSPSSSFFFDDSTRELNDPATELGNLENDILTAGGAESLAASRRRLRSKIRKRTTEEADGLDIELYEYVILFSPGNPGLIGYYRPFLSKLSELLSQKKEDQVEGARERPPISVLGISHAGFSLHDKEETNYEDEDEDEDESDDAENDADEAGGKKTSLPRRKWTNWGPPPYGLQAQIGMKVELIEWIYEWYRQRREDLATIHKDGKSWKKRKLKVILMGHSVGGYILLETVRLLNLRKKERGRNGVDSNGTCNDVDVVGGILLFPTIQDIALSKKGRIFTVCYILIFPPTRYKIEEYLYNWAILLEFRVANASFLI